MDLVPDSSAAFLPGRGRSAGSTRHALLVLISVAIAACGEEPKLGVVDVEQAFQRSPLAMVSAIQLKKQMAPVQGDLKQRGRELAQLRQQLEHGDQDLGAEQRAQIEARLASDTAQLVERQRQYRLDLAMAQERQGEEMVARVEEVATQLAGEQGLTLLLLRDGVLYTADGLEAESVDAPRVDLTEPVIRRLLERINPTEIPEPAEQP